MQNSKQFFIALLDNDDEFESQHSRVDWVLLSHFLSLLLAWKWLHSNWPKKEWEWLTLTSETAFIFWQEIDSKSDPTRAIFVSQYSHFQLGVLIGIFTLRDLPVGEPGATNLRSIVHFLVTNQMANRRKKNPLNSWSKPAPILSKLRASGPKVTGWVWL